MPASAAFAIRKENVSPSAEDVRAITDRTVSVLLPAKDEARNLDWVLSRLPDGLHEVILVDGQSRDGTVAVARGLRPDIRVVTDPGLGKGKAVRNGFAAATGEFVVMLDADGSMDPGEIGRYLALLEEGADFVKGSRCMQGAGSDDLSRIRSAGNWALRSLVNLLYGGRFTDLCYGFMGFRSSCLPQLSLCADGFEIETELVVCAMRAKLQIAEVPSFEHERRYGESNLHAFSDGRRVLATLLRKRFCRLRRISLPAITSRRSQVA